MRVKVVKMMLTSVAILVSRLFPWAHLVQLNGSKAVTELTHRWVSLPSPRYINYVQTNVQVYLITKLISGIHIIDIRNSDNSEYCYIYIFNH